MNTEHLWELLIIIITTIIIIIIIVRLAPITTAGFMGHMPFCYLAKMVKALKTLKLFDHIVQTLCS